MILGLQTGCWAPLRSPGIAASQLPETFRTPSRTAGVPLNFATLTIVPPKDYILGADDQLEIMVVGLYKDSEIRPLRVQVMANGSVQLPLIGAVNLGGKNLLEAQRTITLAYAAGFLANPQVNVTLVEKGSTSVLVLGEVNIPGMHVLAKYQNDVGHALASAGGLSEEAADEIEVHRRWVKPSRALPKRLPPPLDSSAIDHPWGGIEHSLHRPETTSAGVVVKLGAPVQVNAAGTMLESHPFHPNPDYAGEGKLANGGTDSGNILRIPLRTSPTMQLTTDDITLGPGDVIVVPSRRHEVFFVVGRLSTTNTVRFTIGDRERELGVGFVLPRDREIDVVTAVAMAGYIDPIDSPTTVTLQRSFPDGSRMLILVDLIEARCNPNATVLVEPGDIIYLNPDGPWYMRRTIDRVFPEILLSPYSFLMRRLIIGNRNF